jgi:hypothetical protein
MMVRRASEEHPGRIDFNRNRKSRRTSIKCLFFILILILPAIPVPAEDLQPAPAAEALQQYQDFWKTAVPDPMNQVVWKLYVFRAVPRNSDPGAAADFIIAGLTPAPGNGYDVRLKIDQLYNFFHSIPKRGDVIVVKGRILNHQDYLTHFSQKEVLLKILSMDLEGGASLFGENLHPSGTPAELPGAVRPTPAPLSQP